MNVIGVTGDIYLVHRHISGLELGWTIIGLIGMVACLRNMWGAFRDLAALAADPKRGDEITSSLALGVLRTDAVRFLITAAAVSVGLISMTVPTPDPEPPIGALGWSFIALLYTIVVGTSLNAVMDERLRAHIAGALERLENGHAAE